MWRTIALCGGAQLGLALAAASADSLLGRFFLRASCPGAFAPMSRDTFRIVSRGTDGKLRIRDYNKAENLLRMHTQIGIDDCSTDLELRGLPVFRGLIGPMPEGKNIIRYETPEVFETLTKEWVQTKTSRRRSRARTPG
jgi:hypothetical protein